MRNKSKGRFTVIEPTEADKEAIRTGKVKEEDLINKYVLTSEDLW